MEKVIENIKSINEELQILLRDSEEKNNEIEFLTAKDGNLTMKIKGRLIHSQYKPKEEANKIIEKYQFENKELVIIIGAGLGYTIPEIVKKIKDKTKLFIIEDRLELIRKWIDNSELKDILNRENTFVYHTSQKYLFMYKVESCFKLGMTPDFEIIYNKQEYEIFEECYKPFLEIFRDSISNNLVGTSTIFEFAKMWHLNSFKNMQFFENAIGVKDFFKAFKNIPIIVVAAGPSLDKNIKYLHWCKNKAIIIAVGTSLRKVLNEGIVPDFVMGLDGGEPNWEHFRRVEYSDIPFIYEPMVNPKILQYHKGTKIVFVSQNIVGSWGEHVFGEKGFLKMGGSVAITAYDFAVRIGGNPVVLLGQDLAYSGGKTHTSSSVYEKDEVKKDQKDIHQMEVEDIYGGRVLSDRKFHTFIQYFERFIDSDKKNDSELVVIDATEGGAKIAGTTIMSLKEIYYRYIKGQEVSVQDKIIEIINRKKEKEVDLSKYITAKKDLKQKLTETNKNVESGIRILRTILKNNDYSRTGELDKLDKKINLYPEVGNLVKFITQPIIAEILKNANENKNHREILELNLKLYCGIKDGIDFNLKCLEGL